MSRFPNVRIHFTNPINAARKVLNLKAKKINLKLEITDNKKDFLRIKVTSNNNIFGPQPFLAIQTIKNEFIWENFDKGLNEYEWFFTFDNMHIPKTSLKKIGIAANSNDGSTEVLNLDVKSLIIKKYNYCYE